MIVLAAVILLGCAPFLKSKHSSKFHYNLLAVTGPVRCHNISKTYVFCGVVADDEEGRVFLPAADGDMLFFFWDLEKDKELYFQYRDTDGPALEMTAKDFRILSGREIVGLYLSDQPQVWEWLEAVPASELATLRSLMVESLDVSRIPLIKKIADANPTVGLAIKDKEAFRTVLPLFNPRWLILDFEVDEKDLKALSNLNGTEFLSFDAKNLDNLDFLSNLPNLQSLMIGNWQPGPDSRFPRRLKRLKSLRLVDAKIEDLSPIAHLKSLHELHLTAADGEMLVDISALSELPNIEVLTLTGCDNISNISILQKNHALTWFSLPPDITQESFASIIPMLSSLQVLELNGCSDIGNLAPLKELPQLRYLIFLPEIIDDYSVLKELTGLELLVLPQDEFGESPKMISSLRDALPDCRVVPGGACLGSGWVLLLYPAVFLLILFRRKSILQKTGNASANP